ncbi:hypothetical protein JAAARDRAFT_68699 [Jaapia argillacea MUCL 33604]|uniref:Purple acid phosphatase n=1 Tax=Jaapia argillacea MUCL 33604 TaxID=933084 RepID=A0A067Q9A0_9AGAM|nr:hypothetical protein JAAARDRAFT_68699 [Jaapia argillacea MUCL 33604]
MRALNSLVLAVGLILPYLAIVASALPSVPHIVLPDNSWEPFQVRLAYAGSTGMHVSWNTYYPLEEPTVLYGFFPNALHFSASSTTSVTYPTSLTFNNHVKITGLEPDTVYYYRLVGSQEGEILSFRTGRVAGDKTPYSIAVVVDLGLIGPQGLSTSVGNGAANPLKPGETTTIESLLDNGDWDFLWHPGDIAYADYWLREEIQGFLPNTTIKEGYRVYESLLNQFYDEMSVITSIKPWMVGPGNHESNCDNGAAVDPAHNITYNVTICMPGQTNFTGFKHHFRMPSEESGGLGNFWYSFDHGMVHYVQFNTETDLGRGLVGPDEVNGTDGEYSGPFGEWRDEQIEWLEKDLMSVDRRKTPWVVAAGHRPWYVSAPICVPCQRAFEPLFTKYSVDLVLSGHNHLYERVAPMANNISDPKELNNPSFPWYITNGAAGHYDGLGAFTLPMKGYSREGFNTSYGWSRLVFHNCSHLAHEFVASGNGSVLDRATLFKGRECAGG